MQPYFFPYIGYWQLINAVDKFVVYDNIKFTKNSWIRRNRILLNGRDWLFTLPIKNDSDFLDIRDRYLSETIANDKSRLLRTIKMAYYRAPYFEVAYPIIKECFNFANGNLFQYIYNSIITIMEYLKIDTEIIISSTIEMDHFLKKEYRVMEVCRKLEGDIYINTYGGIELYDKKEFAKNGIKLMFLKTGKIEYKQFDNEFIPNLSIIDVMMFNSVDDINKMLSSYEIL